MPRLAILVPVSVGAALVLAAHAGAIDDAHRKKAEGIAAKAVAYLRTQQDATSGGWSIPKEGPAMPAITGLVLNGMLLHPGIDAADPGVAAGVKYLLRFRQSDGGIYDQILPSYNTSIALSTLAQVHTPEAGAAMKPAQDFLRSLQFGEGALEAGTFAGETERVGKEHAYYGGVGYGRSGRPDNSNLTFFLQAMHDSGVPGDDPAFQRALVFLTRTQMLGTVNDMPYAAGSHQGGFIYSTSENKDKVGTGQSFAGTIEETLDDGTKVSRLRAYGSMTYAGFKSYVYARLPKDDPRVVGALEWIRRNYTVSENPGVGTDGSYYYLLTFARALHAWGEPTIQVIAPDGTSAPHDWANDLIDRLGELQNADGSFKSVDDRWMENNPVLITAYSLIALGNAAG